MDRESPDAPAQVVGLLPTGREVRGSVVDVAVLHAVDRMLTDGPHDDDYATAAAQATNRSPGSGSQVIACQPRPGKF